MSGMVSVLMPTGKHEKPSSYFRTIESLLSESREDIEILLIADGWIPNPADFAKYKKVRIIPFQKRVGERITVNYGAKSARGEYVFRIDAHCRMSAGWDVLLKNACGEKNIVFCSLDALREEDWSSLGHNYKFVYITPAMEEKWWSPCHYENDSLDVQPSMSLTGCGYLCRRDFYLRSLYLDEDLGQWGASGPELSVKTEAGGGEILLHKKVKCSHLFHANAAGYPTSVLADIRKKLLQRYWKYLYNLYLKFKPVPGWSEAESDFLVNKEKYFVYNTDVTRTDKTEIKDTFERIVKKIVKIYKPVHYVGPENPDDPNVGKKITQNAEIDRVEISVLQPDGTWISQSYDGEKAKQMFFNNTP